jgi:hypothetical protein
VAAGFAARAECVMVEDVAKEFRRFGLCSGEDFPCLQHLQSRTCGTPDDDTPCRQEPHGSVTQPNIAVVRAKVRNDTFLFQKIGQYEATRRSTTAYPHIPSLAIVKGGQTSLKSGTYLTPSDEELMTCR